MRLSWDKAGERLYETGVDRGVFYPFTTGRKIRKRCSLERFDRCK